MGSIAACGYARVTPCPSESRGRRVIKMRVAVEAQFQSWEEAGGKNDEGEEQEGAGCDNRGNQREAGNETTG